MFDHSGGVEIIIRADCDFLIKLKIQRANKKIRFNKVMRVKKLPDFEQPWMK
jgi:hypothetical protein